MKKALFTLIFSLAAAPAAWACALNDMNCQGWYHNEYLPQQQQRAQQQYTPVQYESRYGALAQSSDSSIWGTHNHPSREAADAYALSGCRERTGLSCEVAWRYANTCIAMARIMYSNGGSTVYVEFSPKKSKAKRMTMKKCKAESGNPSACEHHMAECSLPVRINYS